LLECRALGAFTIRSSLLGFGLVDYRRKSGGVRLI
jgi:hypothetical protein